MPIQKQLSSPKLDHHKVNNSLLIQFVLFELIRSWNEVSEVKTHLSKIKLTPGKRYSKKDKQLLSSCLIHITKLAGYTQQYMRIFTWNLNDGIIAKLKNYTTYFANNLEKQDTDAANLEHSAERAWFNCLECLDLFQEQYSLSFNETANLPALNKITESLHSRLKKLATVTAQILPEFRDDENALLFLLKHQKELAPIYKPGFLKKLFLTLFPNGKEEAECFLNKRYTGRNFKQILPTITEKLYLLMDHA